MFLELVPSTRFSAKPTFASTFANFQCSKADPGYISEQERLGPNRKQMADSRVIKSSSVFQNSASSALQNSMNQNISFQFEDKQKSLLKKEAILNIKQLNQAALINSIKQSEQRALTFDSNKLMLKAARADTYNRLCALGN